LSKCSTLVEFSRGAAFKSRFQLYRGVALFLEECGPKILEEDMKKAWMLLLALLMTLGVGMANASVRSEAMSADINVVEDYDLIFTYPNKVIEYQNTVDFRLGMNGLDLDDPEELVIEEGLSKDWAGVLLGQCKKIGVVGFYMNRPTMVAFGFAENMIDHWHVMTPLPLVDLFWAKNVGGMDLGLQVSYADNKDNANYESTAADPDYVNENKDFARQMGFRLGLGKKDMGPFEQANLAVGYILGSVESSSVTTYANGNYANYIYEGDGIHQLDINVNLTKKVTDNDNMKIFAGFTTAKYGLKETYNDNTNPDDYYYEESLKNTNIVLGLGGNHFIGDGVGLVAAGVKAVFNKTTWENTEVDESVADPSAFEFSDNAFTLPLFVNVETKVRSFLTLRAGAEYYAYTRSHLNVKNTAVATGLGTEEDTYSTIAGNEFFMNEFGQGAFKLTTGFGLNWKNWNIDAMLDTYRTKQVMSNLSLSASALALNIAKAQITYKF